MSDRQYPMHTFQGATGSGLPLGIPGQRPPWFSSNKQYEAFLNTMAQDLGPQCITANSIDIEHLDEQRRKELLAGHALLPTLKFVCTTFAQFDDAAMFSRVGAFEKQFVRRLTGTLAAQVGNAVKNRSVVMPPPALTQLVREVIEWCSHADGAASGAADAHPPLAINDFVHLVLSINGDQERQDVPDFFQSWPPTAEELTQYNAAMSVDDDMMLREFRRQMVSELARMQANATTVPHVVLGDTYDTWFKSWPKAAPHDLIGDAPEDAFRAATNVPLDEFIRLGLRLWEHTKTGEVTFSTVPMEGSVDPQALGMMQNAVSLTVKEYRKRLERERKRGFLAHRRYTFTERPLVRIGDNEYLALRPAWMLDRLCGSQLYWQTFFDFGTEQDPRGEQFSQAMNYVFESSVGYLFRRVTRRARSLITLITEEQMQQAWTRGGRTPSVCDWVLVAGRYCLLVDATNHWLDEKAAQGFGDAEDYQEDTEKAFVSKKFLQLRSTIELLADNGWEGCSFDDQTVYVPLVIVPNAGIPPTVLADVDFKLRSHSVLGQLGKFVTSPGVLIYRELQVFEGVSEHRAPKAFVEMIAQWRMLCTKSMPVRPQTFLDLAGTDRPIGKYPTIARSMLMNKL
ncbi:hypothetical protein OHB12_33360 [Nocardia sp. NBC_01730]|uniref:hypothetical protein n=1 Tax=Nocardia sp. NBC_01730 TaxID=2975998 RepID=UPI002E14E739|nr:hypothetical protein OHB12_33360 [Nocardia sp. NBC_01730]